MTSLFAVFLNTVCIMIFICLVNCKMIWERQAWLKHSFSTPLEDKTSSWFIREPLLCVYDCSMVVVFSSHTQDDKRSQVSTQFLFFYVLLVLLGHIWSLFRIFSYNNVSLYCLWYLFTYLLILGPWSEFNSCSALCWTDFT